ncbi:MAG: CPBP family intramembrane metalloprotease [Candidatus Marinimicrobia bacterium]|jgi:membrane protease YdiL (CAAX protease family)|nr:CPBP family intramembrane metalloprotease [Candidatus Neomarinimicrobiota bacterium]MBT3495995.1 CPBP family intramembrane metalloprotease [Candidatus Neomarinimicrobiota bacterium]MBT3692541.1 CPBP family intramembrane metalloprotease [Candidatus Neomarinimicrobiota bacterium]MBT3732468.1 CPBP family intramembrane metalloprotease [Candidatus Neomarinimicrobiota bacterium]MBT4144951.1 CPBP family intramembrane metalloprotease [Candidatus Neomarinimicrobiota bacterium]
MQPYFSLSKSPFYSFLFTIPLFILYELGVIAVSGNDAFVLRNGADVFMRQFLTLFGVLGVYGFSALFLLGFLATYFYHRHKWETVDFNSSYLIVMFLESIMWAVLLYFSLAQAMLTLMNPNGIMLTQQVVLAIGAGIYEEMLFRVLLIAGLASLFNLIFQWNKSVSQWAGMVLAAIVFSLFHFLGEFGDHFRFDLFFIRFIAGMILGTLYVFRGFGITAYAHSIYDLIVLTQITKNDF